MYLDDQLKKMHYPWRADKKIQRKYKVHIKCLADNFTSPLLDFQTLGACLWIFSSNVTNWNSPSVKTIKRGQMNNKQKFSNN